MGFRRGHSGNTPGRARHGAHDFTTMIRACGAEIDPWTGKTHRRALVERLYHEAINGNVRAMEIVFERHDGKMVQDARDELLRDPEREAKNHALWQQVVEFLNLKAAAKAAGKDHVVIEFKPKPPTQSSENKI